MDLLFRRLRALMLFVVVSVTVGSAAAEVSCSSSSAVPELITAKTPSLDVVLLFHSRASTPEPIDALQRFAKRVGMRVLVGSFASNRVGADGSKSTIVAALERDSSKFFVPTAEYLSFKARGLSESDKVKVVGSKSALSISFALPTQNGMSEFVVANSVVSSLANETEAFIFDRGTREVFSGKSWADVRTGEPPDLLSVDKHITIHVYRDKDYLRAVTLGMSKFGLPELAVPELGSDQTEPVGQLVNAIAQRIVEAPLSVNRGTSVFSVQAMKPTQWKKSLLSKSPRAMPGDVRVCLREGLPHEGDAENRLLNIGFDLEQGSDRHAKRSAFLRRAFGASDSDVRLARSGDDELLAASRRARDKIPRLRADFVAGLAPRERLAVKAAFKTDRSGVEYMWVQIASWNKDGEIRGLLLNEPREIPTLQVGQEVRVRESDFYDYIRTFEDGRVEGNETGKLLETRAKARRP